MANRRAAIVYEAPAASSRIEVTHGSLGAVRRRGPRRTEVEIRGAKVGLGSEQTRLTLRAGKASFTFFLRDVSAATPIYVPEHGLAVTTADDRRSYQRIADDIRRKGLCSMMQRIEHEPEESYENACRHNRDQVCPTWLGLSRDMRIFEVAHQCDMGYWGFIRPRYHFTVQNIPETGGNPYKISYAVGPGASCRIDITRRLEDGVLPILRSTQVDGDVAYNVTVFATLETQPITRKALRGTDWRAAYPNAAGHMLSQAELQKLAGLLQAEMRGRQEEVVCWTRIEAVNSARVGRYAWFKAAKVGGRHRTPLLKPARYDSSRGFGALESGRVFAIHLLDGKPMPQEEVAVLVPPGGKVVMDLLVPHQPIPHRRARQLARQDFDRHVNACRDFWRAKLASAAQVRLPEQAVDERLRAGLLHCDLVAFGREPRGSVLANIGWYAPIGSESAPIIQFFDSMGWHGLAERAMQFFLDRQREDGFIQNFGGYQLETGPALWTMGEHYRYTRDDAWVRRIKPRLLKACEFLLAWRQRNCRRDLRGRGYGLLDGKVADPEDFFHSFMLNGLSYLGIARTAEMLAKVAPAESRRLAKEARAFKADIRVALAQAMTRSPVVPLGDGTWAPFAPPWAEYAGPLALYADGGTWCTHGTFAARDSMIGSLYLILSEVLDANEPAAAFLLRSHQELFTIRNAALSQPYYCRHDIAHLQRGEVKAFLKTYYNQFTALQDRQTYTFWEHYFGAGQHKTHEEGWFLMQTRWMLYLERGRTLELLPGIPRAWLEQGKRIELRDVASYFGPLSLTVESDVRKGSVRAHVECQTSRRPRRVILRLPHPDGQKAEKATGGRYDADEEAVLIERFGGKADVTLRF